MQRTGKGVARGSRKRCICTNSEGLLGFHEVEEYFGNGMGEGKRFGCALLPEGLGLRFLLLLVIPGKGMRRRWELLLARLF